jgi:hypothetical protein
VHAQSRPCHRNTYRSSVAQLSSLCRPNCAQRGRGFRAHGPGGGHLALAQAALYLAVADKSNAGASAFGTAMVFARSTGLHAVPPHLAADSMRPVPSPEVSPNGPGAIDTQIARHVVASDEEAFEALSTAAAIGRIGQLEEIASAVLWLCSPYASYVVGHPLVIDDGLTVAKWEGTAAWLMSWRHRPMGHLA